MDVYTYQLAHHRRLKGRDIVLVDTSVKTGHIQLAPSWDMVMSIKKTSISEIEYTRRYREILDYWWFRDPLFFDHLFTIPVVAFGCYCKAGVFCHRHLLVDFIKNVTPLTYKGEIT